MSAKVWRSGGPAFKVQIQFLEQCQQFSTLLTVSETHRSQQQKHKNRQTKKKSNLQIFERFN